MTEIIKQSKIQQEVQKHKTPKESYEAEAVWKANEAYHKEQNDFEQAVGATMAWILQRRRTTELIEPEINHGDHGLQSNRGNDVVTSVTLADFGFTKMQWQRRKKLLDIQIEQIADYFDECIEMSKQPTLYGLLKKIRRDQLEQEREVLAEDFTETPKDKRFEVFKADIRTVELDKQFDFIITDPPYIKEYLPLYETLAERANEWLKPGGLLVAMCGQSYLNEIMEMMSQHIDYYWMGCYHLPGQPTPLRQRQVNCSWKPILIMGQSDYGGKIFSDYYVSENPEKQSHEWGQSVSGMLDIVSQICLPGQSVLDPFCGAGATGIASLKHGCLFAGFDNDEGEVNKSLRRLSEI